ncbi:acetyltransferase [Pyrococcus sp. NA2]|uniref:GNAT family N-acetyltransferase n=1 Tax=Pyrococcus sp. (strain NA2) TaxID=342949 RepID=UPI000209AC7B|nr:GNAT family N-acetyltransferase [Pyrococcus sp. NA2]AEC52763.1 acetyltransferase [Pyrococcus sp. NA2]
MRPIIRKARPEDKPFIEEIARLTWGGGDYIADVFDEWVGDNFYVLEINGKVIGTVKLTILPGKVGWLEGLRVHPNYRRRGYGKMLHNFIIDVGKKLAREGKIEALEFATYFLIRESISMAEKTGFYVKAKFFIFGAKVNSFEPEEPKEVELKLEHLTLGIIPVGWRFIKRSAEAVDWIRKNATLYETNGLYFLAPKSGTTFTPLDIGLSGLKAMLPAMAWVAKERGEEEFDVMLPGGVKPLLQGIKKLNLYLWDDTNDPNVLVFRKEEGL